MSLINKVIAIQNYGTSGTTLLHALLDDHPKIVSMPMLYALPLYRVWEQILSDNDFSDDTMHKRITSDLPFLFNAYADGGDASLGQMGEGMNERVDVEEEEFFSYFRNRLSSGDVNRKNFLISIYLAFNDCHGNKFSDESFICFPIHSQEKKYAEYLIQDFDEVYFLHMVREPVQSMGSLIKHVNHNQIKNSLFKSLVFCVVSQIVLEKMIHWHEKYLEVFGKRGYFLDKKSSGTICISRAIRLEDLHRDPIIPLESFCQLVGVEWCDKLLKTTFMGKLWHNRAESVRVSGFNQAVISQRHDSYLSEFDKYRLKLLTKTEQNYFKYARFDVVDRMLYLLLPFLFLAPFRADFNKKRFIARLNAMLKKYSNNRKISIAEWILFNDTSNTNAGAYIAESGVKIPQVKSLQSLTMSLPFFVIRIIENYLIFRFEVIKIWFGRLYKNDSNGYVKMLYDIDNFDKK